MRWSITNLPVVLHAKPKLVKNKELTGQLHHSGENVIHERKTVNSEIPSQDKTILSNTDGH